MHCNPLSTVLLEQTQPQYGWYLLKKKKLLVITPLKMLNKEQIKLKLKELESQTELLELSRHKALGEWIIIVPAHIKEAGITSKASQFEDRPDVGILVSVGDDVDGMVAGDVVFFGRYGHTQVTHDDIPYLIMRAEDVYCVT